MNDEIIQNEYQQLGHEAETAAEFLSRMWGARPELPLDEFDAALRTNTDTHISADELVGTDFAGGFYEAEEEAIKAFRYRLLRCHERLMTAIEDGDKDSAYHFAAMFWVHFLDKLDLYNARTQMLRDAINKNNTSDEVPF